MNLFFELGTQFILLLLYELGILSNSPQKHVAEICLTKLSK